MELQYLNKGYFFILFFTIFYSCNERNKLLDTYKKSPDNYKSLIIEVKKITQKFHYKDWGYTTLEGSKLNIFVKVGPSSYKSFIGSTEKNNINLEYVDVFSEDSNIDFFTKAHDIVESSNFQNLLKKMIEEGILAAKIDSTGVFLTDGKAHRTDPGNIYYKGLLVTQNIDDYKYETKLNDSLYIVYRNIR